MSRVGSPATATRSASSPGVMRPTLPSSWRIFAFPLVAARSVASGLMPYSTMASSSRTFSPCGKTPTSPPKQIDTPASRAARKLARLATRSGGGASRPLTQPSK